MQICHRTVWKYCTAPGTSVYAIFTPVETANPSDEEKTRHNKTWAEPKQLQSVSTATSSQYLAVNCEPLV
jgi:hypothetical protein